MKSKLPPRRMKKIVVATDFSADSKRALEYAAALAGSSGARIILIHVIESLPYSVTDTFTVIDHRRALRQTASALLANLRSELAEKNLSVKAHLASGAPTDEILKTARRENADLIVLGTRGRGAVARLLLGSVADKVIRLADRPVLTIPGGSPAR